VEFSKSVNSLQKNQDDRRTFIHLGAAGGFFTSMNYLTDLQGSFSAKDFSRSKKSSQ
jgi:hypothetical protein